MTLEWTGAGSDAGSAAPHILVVDGDDQVLERTQTLLEASGYEVTVADLPDIGLVRRVEPDAIVIGLFYRGRPAGLEFLERQAADPAIASVPVVVHAGGTDLSDEQRLRLAQLTHPVIDHADGPEGAAAELLAQLRASLSVAIA